MKDRRFKELINLYLDNEISESEASELEAELQRNPARRRDYHDYCCLHRGCVTLFEAECARAPQASALQRALRDAERRMEQPVAAVAFWQRRSLWAYGSMAAMAASLVLVVGRVQRPGALATAPADPAQAPAQYALGPQEAAPGGAGAETPLVVAASAPSTVRPSHGTLRGISVPGWVLVSHEAARPATSLAGRLALGISEPVINLPEPAIHTDIDSVNEHSMAYEPVPATGLRGPTSALGSGYKVEMTSYQFQR